VINITL